MKAKCEWTLSSLKRDNGLLSALLDGPPAKCRFFEKRGGDGQ